MTHDNAKTFEWINKQRDWIPEEDLWTVVYLNNDGQPVCCMSFDIEDCWQVLLKNKHKVLYFFKQFKDEQK